MPAHSSLASESQVTPEHQAQNEHSEKIQTMRIMVAKFRDLLLSIQDINKLESIGMSRADADLMRLALQEKIKQTQTQTLDSIWSLKKS